MHPAEPGGKSACAESGKKAPVVLRVDQVSALLAQPSGRTPKEIRDKAMLALLYATGIRVSELIGIRMEDINMNIGFLVCRDGERSGRSHLDVRRKQRWRIIWSMRETTCFAERDRTISLSTVQAAR